MCGRVSRGNQRQMDHQETLLMVMTAFVILAAVAMVFGAAMLFGMWKSAVENWSSAPHFGQWSLRPLMISPRWPVSVSPMGLGKSVAQVLHFTKRVGTFLAEH